MTVKCFSVHAVITFHDTKASYEAHFKRSHDVRNWLKECLKDPDVASITVDITREARDPVENTSI
jgi:hypothetical protein